MDGRRVRQLGIALALGLTALLWWWDPGAGLRVRPPPKHAKVRAPLPSSAGAGGVRAARRGQPSRAGTRAPAPAAADDCLPQAELACRDGDVYWLDSCGQPSELFERCERRGCADARCEAAVQASDCGRTSAYGQCSGNVAEACIAGKLVRVDCESRRERCVMTGEGAACLPVDREHGCRGDEPPRCEGDALELCVDGTYQTIDCSARRAHCSDRGGAAHCERDPALPLPQLGRLPEELCDDKDNDGDTKVDEGDACAVVPLVAFVAEGAALADHELRMEQDLAILNQVFAPTQFRWDRVRKAPASYRQFDPKDMESAASTLGQSEASWVLDRAPAVSTSADDAEQRGLDFYVPVLYAEALKLQPPKSGLSTLPNARCGGVRISDIPSPVSGLIVLTESRQPETLAHEMGHYLGLCHTHEDVARFAVHNDAIANCERTGDSICDTPFDPGPPDCFLTGPCELTCRDASRPDPFNIMSYYLGCRRMFTAEQLAEAARNLQLRRTWFRCQDPRACPCEPASSAACPQEMSCRPSGEGEAPWYCALDGASLPGTPCDDAAQCSNHSFCAGTAQEGSARCVRPCSDEAECSCLDVGLPVQICREDLGI